MDTDYQNKHYNINQKDEGTQDDRGSDGGTNFISRIKEQEIHLTLQEHDDDDDGGGGGGGGVDYDDDDDDDDDDRPCVSKFEKFFHPCHMHMYISVLSHLKNIKSLRFLKLRTKASPQPSIMFHLKVFT